MASANKKIVQLVSMFALAMCVVAPAGARAGDATIIGTGVGAAVGGVLGSQFGHGAGQIVATGVGIGVGGLVGNTIGNDIDHQDAPTAAVAPSGNYYASAPVAYAPNYVAPPAPPPIYIDENAGTYCRPYSQEVTIAGRVQEAYGTACLQPDGSWRVVR